ncbi:MAG TPA: hypothetical protein VK419_00435 [Bryobacteraceae bacterium]|nr:hypothetical protein [Bryobacteraceae bacterium]
MRSLLLLAASVSSVFAGVDGVVINGTTGKPQAAVMVSLMQPSAQGLQTLATVRSDAEGKFKIDKEVPSGGPVMVQAIFDKASYTEMLPPGTPTSGIQVQVFDSGSNPEAGKIAGHMILIEPQTDGTQVTETFMFNNQTKLTYSDPAKGSAEFFLPKAATGKPQVTVTSATGMPIQWTASKTKNPDVYKIDFPIKPGQTRIDVGYALPPSDTFTGKNVDPSAPTRVVTPGTVTLSGEGLDLLGQEPQTQARIYNLRTPNFEVKVDGTGSLRNPQADSQEDAGQPQIEIAPARIYSRMYWVLGLTFAILALGGAMLYRRGTV